MISKRHSRANNPLVEGFDPSQPKKYIMYLDANNLYGFSMVQALPTREFVWMEADEFSAESIARLDDDGDTGFIFEVDLRYPESLHVLHNEYPLAPENLSIHPSMLSPHLIKMCDELKLPHPGKVTKLTPNLYEKKNYVVHYRNLKLYLELGLQLIKIHKVLRFRQSPWLKSYIEFNTEQRKLAKNSFEKDFFKLMNNAVFGKTMENLRNRKNIVLTTEEKRSKKLIASPSFHSFKIFSEDFAAVEMKKVSLTLNRPIYVGFTILDISKTLMYQFHYNYIKSKYGERASLLFTDTDSLCYEIATDDVYKDMGCDSHHFDTSDYPRTHHLFSEVNKKVIGKFKDELNGVPIVEFVGLRPKMYSILSGGGEKKTAKGVSKNVIKKRLKHQSYKDCLFQKMVTREDMLRISSDHHQLQTVTTRKIALSPLDDKRYIQEDGVNTYAYGHFANVLNMDEINLF